MNKHYQTIRRVIITGPMTEQKEALQWCWDNEYDTRRMGPFPLKAGQVDIKRFKIVAEKVINA